MRPNIPMVLNSGTFQLDLTTPQVMGILNVTPDSFSDGGRFLELSDAIQQAEVMVAEGAAMIDIGGESTRPGAQPVSEQEELDRVLPVIEALAHRLDVWLSVDTSNAKVMFEAAKAGVHLINDVRALTRPGALAAAAATQLPICLMHIQGAPSDMQNNPEYQDVGAEVMSYLADRLEACQQAGIPKERILLDPGFGFGKTRAHNYQLLRELERLHALGCPLLVGMSRKRMIGEVLNQPLEQRLYGSIAAASIAAMKGASILRVHDVAATVDAMRIVAETKHSEQVERW